MQIYRMAICVVLGASMIQAQQLNTVEEELLVRVREADSGRVQALLRAGADPDTRDATGATALMNAAAYATPQIMRSLLDAGASPDATSPSGATALMWATQETEKVRLLLDRGATVNAGRPDGVTALVSASLRGNTRAMQFLLDAGANMESAAVMAPWRMEMRNIAYTTNDPAVRELLESRGVQPGNLSAWMPPPLSSWILTNVFSWRPQPVTGHAALLRKLLDAGADPNETVAQLTLTVPALSRVVRMNDLEATILLLDRGADPNAKGSRGLTPLMMSAAGDSAAIVQLLLNRGAVVDARDENGRTALDWALLRGESRVSRILRNAGAKPMARPPVPPASVSSPRTARTAIKLAIDRLQPAGLVFHEKTGCISCHNQSLPAIAVKVATDKGIAVDKELARHPREATLKVWGANRENFLVGNCAVFGFLANVSYGLLGLAEEKVAPNEVTDAVTHCLSGLQNSDGSWEGGDLRPPLSARSPVVFTALAVRGLKEYTAPGRRRQTDDAIARARNFLRSAALNEMQDETFKLLGLIWSGAPAGEVTRQAGRVMELQREDGGWSQFPEMQSDAYATGQALYALHASGVTASNAAYQRGAQYLLRTQLEDGTWHVTSRAIGFQPYIETGFPHGTDQFISAAATAWAAIALGYTL